VSNLLNLVKDLSISLLRNSSLLRIAAAPLFNEELFKYILEIKLSAPAPALSERHSYTVAVINLCELISVCRINNMSAKYARECVAGKASALAGTAACDYEISSARVKQNSGKNTYLYICKLFLILS